MIWVGLWLLLMALLVLLGPVLTPFIVGAILAYALNPWVERICKWKIGKFPIPRVVAVIMVMVSLVAAVVALILVIVPVVQNEIPLLQEQIPNFLVRMNQTLGPWLHELDIQVTLDPANIKRFLSEQYAASSNWLWKSVLESAKVGGTTVLGWLVTLILIPVVLFYLLLDWRTPKGFMLN